MQGLGNGLSRISVWKCNYQSMQLLINAISGRGTCSMTPR